MKAFGGASDAISNKSVQAGHQPNLVMAQEIGMERTVGRVVAGRTGQALCGEVIDGSFGRAAVDLSPSERQHADRVERVLPGHNIHERDRERWEGPTTHENLRAWLVDARDDRRPRLPRGRLPREVPEHADDPHRRDRVQAPEYQPKVSLT